MKNTMSAIIACCAAASLDAGAAEAPFWQQEGHTRFGFNDHELGFIKCAGGLSFKVQDSAYSCLFRDGVGVTGEIWGFAEGWFLPKWMPKPIVGRLSSSDPGPRADIEGDWTHFTVRYDDCAMHVSRLTPAVLLETESDAVQFVNDPREWAFQREIIHRKQLFITPPLFPKFMAYGAAADDITVHALTDGMEYSFADNLEQDGLKWILLWYGPEFVSTDVPLSYALRWHSNGWGFVHGIDSRGDQPLLLVFANPPSAFEAHPSAGRLQFSFDGPAGAVAMVQPFERFYQVIDTSAWKGAQPAMAGIAGAAGAEDANLPAAVFAACESWAERLEAFPMGVTETWKTLGDGAVEIAENFEYLYLDPDNKPEKLWMPLPPIWALAAEEGFPIELGSELEDSGVRVYCGPYRGIWGDGSYTARVASLARYWREVRKWKDAAAEPDANVAALTDALAGMISQVVEAGHLAPWFNLLYKYSTRLVWENSAETLFYLAQCLELLPADNRAALAEYLKREDAEYPADTVAWRMPPSRGARREWGIVSPYANPAWDEVFTSLRPNYYCANDIIPPENLYALACLYENAPAAAAQPFEQRWPALRELINPSLCRYDWATGSFFYGQGGDVFAGRANISGVMEQNRWFAAAVGLARLANRANDAETLDLASYLLAKSAMTRFAMAKFVPNLYKHKLQRLPPAPDPWLPGSHDFSGVMWSRFHMYRAPEDDPRQVVKLDEFSAHLEGGGSPASTFSGAIFPFVGLTPELGRFLSDFARSECVNFIRAAEKMPNYYMTQAEDSWGKEQGVELPESGLQIFLAKAWIEQTDAADLAGILDVPWTRLGDYYHIHKLSELIRACRGFEWLPQYR